MKTISIAALLLGSLSPALVASPVPQEAPASNQEVFNLLYEMIAQQADGMADVIERGNTPESHEEMSLVIPRFWRSVDLSRVPAFLYPYVSERQLLASCALSFLDRYPDVHKKVAGIIFLQEMSLVKLLNARYEKEHKLLGDLYVEALMGSGLGNLMKDDPDTLDQAQRVVLIKQIRETAAALRAKVKPAPQLAHALPTPEQRALSLYALRRMLRGREAQIQLYREGKVEDVEVFFKTYEEAKDATPVDGLAPRMQEFLKALGEAHAKEVRGESPRVQEKYKQENLQFDYAEMRVLFDCMIISPEAALELSNSMIPHPEGKEWLPQRIKVIESMVQMLRERIATLEAEMKA